MTVVVDPAPTPTATSTHTDCPSPTGSAAPVGAPAEDAAEVSEPDHGAAVSIEVGQRVSIRLPTASTIRGYLTPSRPNVPIGLALRTPTGLRYLAQGLTNADGWSAVRASLPRGPQTLVVYTSARAGVLRGSAARSVHVG